MNGVGQAKLLLEENIGKSVYIIIRDLFSLIKTNTPVVAHLVEDFKAGGVDDTIWVKAIASDNWIVISADHALSLVCKRHNVTHVIISGRLHTRPQFEKACAIIEARDRLLNLQSEPKGTTFSLQMNPIGRARVVKKDSVLKIRPRKLIGRDASLRRDTS